jgi:crotonobetainyl-CoA:carnitine CoA-transferase CaiB-like acyl-CoA transferase
MIGEDTEEILRDLGYDEERIADLVDSEVV